ncbi:MAG: glutamate--tRNA ligase [Holosporales bacterium]|nr:glutamate--tRNA ligase [Holosporales bacterium]
MKWVRFAPSPTGLLHVGNARAALLNYLYAQQEGAQFLLRIDDTDTERSKPEFVEAIKHDLGWLGISWNRIEFQSARLSQYKHAAEQLRSIGRLYPCYETPEELAFQRKALLTQGKPPVYNRAALTLSIKERKSLEEAGRIPYWRFRLHEDRISWEDGIYSTRIFEGTYASDPVLIRADGVPVYTLASVVDDLEFGISCVIRGADHITNTAVQIQLLEALNPTGVAHISWAHYPLFRMRSGEELSKRAGSMSLQSLREEGIHPLAVNSFLATLGTSEALDSSLSLEDLIARFGLTKINLAEAQFDPQDLRRFNQHVLSKLSFKAVETDLYQAGITISPEFWVAVRENINSLKDVARWKEICFGTPFLETPEEDLSFLKACLHCAENASDTFADSSTWESFVKELSQSTGRRGRHLFHSLRRVLTGQDSGPELHVLISFIGRTRMMERIRGQISATAL